jgi:hypothetical protein
MKRLLMGTGLFATCILISGVFLSSTVTASEQYKGSKNSTATQQPPFDVIDKVFADLSVRHNGSFLCMPQGASRESVRATLLKRLKNIDTNDTANANVIGATIYTAFPCPFSPYRDELRRATEKDIEGVWLYPETSQKLRFGPKSPNWQKNVAMPIKCESVAYYPRGEARTVQAVGQRIACPFLNAKDTDMFHQSNLKVESWQMIKEGLVKISRTDVPDRIEEWEMFSVVKPFEMWNIQFKVGDLIAYLRREKGNNLNAATVFRHLQRLP